MSSLTDYPSLRDLETSNMLSSITHNFNMKKYLDQKRMQTFEYLKNEFMRARTEQITFAEVTQGYNRKQATEMFISLQVFASAGLCEIRQEKMPHGFC